MVNFYNTSLTDHFKKKFRLILGSTQINNLDVIKKILNKLNLKKTYSKLETVEIIDIFPNPGLFQSMINYELKPKKHVLIDNDKANSEIWQNYINYLKQKTKNKENFDFYLGDGYKWETYDRLINNSKIINPKFQSRNKIHDELLILANISLKKHGEYLFAQWINCIAYRNWLHKYGRVKMLCFVHENIAKKFMTGSCNLKRNKASMKKDIYTNSRIICITESNPYSYKTGTGYDPNIIFRDQPIVLKKKDLSSNKNISLIEIDPKNISNDNIEMKDYIMQCLFFKPLKSVFESMGLFGNNCVIDLAPKIPKKILNKTVKDLLIDEWNIIFNVFYNWRFKPSLYEIYDLKTKGNYDN